MLTNRDGSELVNLRAKELHIDWSFLHQTIQLGCTGIQWKCCPKHIEQPQN